MAHFKPYDENLEIFGKLLYGDREWKEGLAKFFKVDVSKITGWLHHGGPGDRYSRLNAEVKRRQLSADLPHML